METTGEISVGQIVKSKAGRDKNRLFFVIDIINDQFVLIVDGDLRKIEKPKMKKIKHLKMVYGINKDIQEKLERNEKINNIYLKRELEKLEII
ncbi:MAG: KOW domain-containing RNA-binding protein [Peptostreptococcales bacterium]